MSKWFCGCGQLVFTTDNGKDDEYQSAECVICAKTGNYIANIVKPRKPPDFIPQKKGNVDKNGIKKLGGKK